MWGGKPRTTILCLDLGSAGLKLESAKS